MPRPRAATPRLRASFPPDDRVRRPFEERRRPPVTGLLASLAVHGLVVLVALGLAHQATPVLERLEQEQAVALLPQEILIPPPPQQVEVPAPPVEEPPPPNLVPPSVDEEPDLPLVDDPGSVPEQERDPDPSPEAPTSAPELDRTVPRLASPSAPPSTAAAAPSMESEARRIFGGPRRRGRGSPEGTEDGQPLPPPLTNGECPFTIPPAAAGEPTRMTSASGRVLREGTRVPLEGALLQVVGTPYSTMSGVGGAYLLTLPLELVANCRVQYVRIVAAGYRSRLLPLTLSEVPASDDVELRRR